jgi:RNA polymerase sigma factor (TIGR02999 family)
VGKAAVSSNDVTGILAAMENGDPQTAEQLLPLVYDELKRLAAAKLAQERPGHTLQPTALVHEAYLRLVGDCDDARWNNRRHFFMAAAEAMRRILVDNARRKLSSKHGGGWCRSDLGALDADALPDPGAGAEAEARSEAEVDLAALDLALNRLAEVDPQKAKLVELRYFAGLSGDQAAEVLGISPSSVDRQWVYTRAWLRRELGNDAQR